MITRNNSPRLAQTARRPAEPERIPAGTRSTRKALRSSSLSQACTPSDGGSRASRSWAGSSSRRGAAAVPLQQARDRERVPKIMLMPTSA